MNKKYFIVIVGNNYSHMSNHPHCAVRACEQDQVSRFCVSEGNFMRHICKLYGRARNVDMEVVKYISYKTGTIETLVWIC